MIDGKSLADYAAREVGRVVLIGAVVALLIGGAIGYAIAQPGEVRPANVTLPFLCADAADVEAGHKSNAFAARILGVDSDGDEWSYAAHEDGRWLLRFQHDDIMCISLIGRPKGTGL